MSIQSPPPLHARPIYSNALKQGQILPLSRSERNILQKEVDHLARTCAIKEEAWEKALKQMCPNQVIPEALLAKYPDKDLLFKRAEQLIAYVHPLKIVK
jgi:hypothetical protein